MFGMNIRFRTVLVLFFMLLLAFFVVNTIGIYWIMFFVALVSLFVGSMFLFLYFGISEQKTPLLKEWPLVSVIIPNYNGERHLLECVEAVKRMKYSRGFEILVVDDGSTDNSIALLKRVKGIKLIAKKENEGKAAALNTGLKNASGELVACIDSDTFPSDNCLMEMIPLISDPKVGAVIGAVRVFNSNNLLERIQEVEYFSALTFYQAALAVINAGFVTPGPMSVYRKKLLLDLGGYALDNITEDMEIALRIQRAGYEIRAASKAQIFTIVPSTVSHWFRQRLRWYRGKVFNVFLYKDLFFRKNNSGLGFFSWPFSLLLEFSSIFLLCLLFVVFFRDFFNFFSTVFVWLSLNAFPLVDLPPVIANSVAIFFWIVAVLVFGYPAFLGMRLAGERITLKMILPLLLMMFVYGFAISIVWFLSLFLEINKSMSKW